MLELFTRYFAQLGYLIVALATLAEGLTLPCPALAVLLMAGAAVASGKLSFVAVVLVAATSYTLGAVVPYLIGLNLPRMRRLPWAGRFIEASLKYLDQVNQLFIRHGDKIVALARPFWIGNCVSYFAGLSRMRPGKFLAFTFLGIGTWSATVVFLGQLFSANLGKASRLIKQYSTVVFFAVVLLALAAWGVSKLLKSRKGVPANE